MASRIGEQLSLEVWGASHAPEIGISVTGLPKGFEIDMARVQDFLNRRRGGQNAYSTKRVEADEPHIQCGVEEKDGKTVTTGEKLTAIFYNKNTRSSDYDEMRYVPRPSHADYTSYVKYGDAHDRSGGGMFSGRMTLPLCFAGAVCMQILKERGIEIFGHISSIGTVTDAGFDPLDPKKVAVGNNASSFPVMDNAAGEAMVELMNACAAEGDSVGGTVECAVVGLPAGVGEPLYAGMEAVISNMIFGIPAVKGIEFGSGFRCSEMKGSSCNDPFIIRDGKILTSTNHSGGIQGGISNGMPVIFRVAFKPTPSIYKEQKTVNMKDLTPTTLSLQGRHDPCIVPRALPCVEAVTAVAIYNLLLEYDLWEAKKTGGGKSAGGFEKPWEKREITEAVKNSGFDSESDAESDADSNQLSHIRSQIDVLDTEIATLLSKRMDLAFEIAGEKSRQGIKVKNPARETEVLNHVAEIAGDMKGIYVKEVYRKLIQETCNFEEKIMGDGN